MSDHATAAARQVDAPFASSHKFIPPLPLGDALQRSRLTAGILGKNRYSAVVIQGPAGHGKTTLMQQILQALKANSVSVNWLTLDESDNDMSRISACLTTLIHSALGGADSEDVEAPPGRSKSTGTAENILHSLARTDQPIAFFLDEFQVLYDPAIVSLLNSLLERIPPNVTFYIGTRSIPELARGRLMISGRVKWITPEELCFTPGEVYEFLQNVGLPAIHSEAEAFQERTGGWPAVLQLLQLALRSGKLSRSTLLAWAAGCQNELRDYLADNVMALQSPRCRRFLLRTSILGRLTAPICELITGIEDAQQMLQDFVTQGLFLRSIDVEHRWFRYHSIFSDYLAAQLARTEPHIVRDLHATAAHWFRDHGYQEDAIYHSIEAGKPDLAAEILADWIPDLVRTARLRAVERLAKMVPRQAFEKHPMLLWGHTWALLFLNQPEPAHQSLMEFEQSLQKAGSHPDMVTSLLVLKCAEALITDQSYCNFPWLDSLAIETGDMAKHRCFEMNALANAKAISRLEKGLFTEAKEFALLGESLGARGEAAFSGAYSTSLLAYAHILDGHLDQAITRLHNALNDEYLNVQGSFASVSLSAVYGFALYESGNFADAESQLRDSLDILPQTLPVDWLISAFLSLARAAVQSEPDGGDSQEILDNGERLGLINRIPRLVRAIRYEKIRLALTRGNCREARNLFRVLTEFPFAALPQGWTHFAEGCDDDFVCQTRLDIFCNNPLSVLEPLQTEISAARRTGHIRREIKLLILQSLAHSTLDNTAPCQNAMLEAVRLAAPAGYISTFLEEGDRCTDILLGLLENAIPLDSEPLRPFVDRLLSIAGIAHQEANDVTATGELIEPLTKKEVRILQLVVNGSTNAEMADQLFVSKNTVKFHLKNVYAKLGVANRVQATGIARKMGLI